MLKFPADSAVHLKGDEEYVFFTSWTTSCLVNLPQWKSLNPY